MDRLPRIRSAVVTGRRVTGGLVDLPHRMLVAQDEGDRIASGRHMTQSSSPMRSEPSRHTG
jgi:hypothetical protein